ncbi:MAG: MATE family efflux transporter [Eubacterium sp.]|nr:MATE family efflux transporter [Eubacterium sp.]
MKNDMLKGSIVKSIVIFALPIMASALLQYSYNLVDNIIVGRYISEDALAAVGCIGPINGFIIGTALGLTSGFTIPVSQKFGAGDKRAMNMYAGSSITLSLMVGIAIVILAHIVSNPILRLIRTPENIIELSSAYINILYFGVPFQMLFNNFTSICRAVGDSKKPMLFIIISVITNLVLDILFVGVLSLGVEGASAATVISYGVAALFSGVYVMKKQPIMSIKKKDLKPNVRISWEQLKLGIPVSLQFTITSIGSMILQSAINSFGSTAVAAITAAGKVEQITNIPMSALGVANSTFVAQNYGAKNYKRIVSSVRRILVLDLIVCVVCSTVLILAGPYVVRLFIETPSSEIMGYAKQYLYTIGGCYFLVSLLYVFRNTLQGLGFTYANTVAGAGELVGRLLVAYCFARIFGFAAVCFAGPVAWLLADIPLIILYLRVKKQKLLLQS